MGYLKRVHTGYLLVYLKDNYRTFKDNWWYLYCTWGGKTFRVHTKVLKSYCRVNTVLKEVCKGQLQSIYKSIMGGTYRM